MRQRRIGEKAFGEGKPKYINDYVHVLY